MEQVLFAIYAIAACGGALGVVFSQSVVRMAFWLVVSLGATAGLFFLLNADFVGATQLLIYVGGTVVLLIFGVMLTSSSPFASLKMTPAELLQGGFIGIALFGVFMVSVLAVDWKHVGELLDEVHPSQAASGFNPAGEGDTARPLGTALIGVRFDQDLWHNDGTSSAVKTTPSTGYLLVFEIISMHLLVVLIGAAYL
ncbi:MAG TPA: NADH-quinone oxidoreductase subunit J, partial [Planctomicrobium sp.]|nr:NADH-quinone oxidoreductase subunit J [Planctomicrobium sp.]